MSAQGLSEILQGVEESSFNPKHALAWLEEHPADEQASLAKDIFQALLQSAAKPKQSSGNACVKLCGLVELCSRSQSPCLKEFAFKEGTSMTMFNFFIEWNEQDAHRSMRLVLDFLVHAATHNPSPETGATIRTRLLAETISMITEKSSRPSIKSALTALDHMILKKLIYLDDVLSAYSESRKSSSNEQATWETMVYQIFEWMVLHYVCPAAGKLIVTILTSPWHRDRDERHRPSTWHSLIYPALESNAELLEPIRLYVLIPLFKADRAGALEYLQQLTSLQGLTGDRGGEGWNLNAMLWLSMLEAGKKIGVVDEPGQGLKQKPGAVTQLDTRILDEVLCHESHEARSSAVAILIASPSTTRPYTPEVLDLLRKHLPSFHSDASSKFRYEVLGHTRNMIKRIHGALESVRREYEKTVKKAGAGGASPAIVEQLEQTLRKHRAFVSWYLEFLKTEMSPTASYQRHITALKAMNFVLGSPLIQESEIVMFQDASRCALDLDWLRCVLDLVMDPFDDVRDAAAGLIMRLGTYSIDEQSSNGMRQLKESMAAELEDFCKRADELASKTARADHSDGLARSYQLLHLWKSNLGDNWLVSRKLLGDLEKKLSSAECDLAAAVLDAPVHGDFAALRYLWTSLGSTSNEEDAQTVIEVRNRAIQCCEKIWLLVQHILCDDSPEGHLPEELEEVDGLDTKDLLSYSFRAIHESSNLLRVIASGLAATNKKSLDASNRTSFETIGRLTFAELSNLRHRGAFTTVSHTFATCCQLVKHFPNNNSSSNLLYEWYQGALQCIQTQRSTTRRSAGIPALIVGILSANEEKPSFHDVLQGLQEISRRPAFVAETDGSNLPQVHAMNSLKDIFKSSFLSKRAEPYLTQCLQLAADCLKSEVWAIRNCGLLLLRSLIDCLLGTNESKTSMEAGWDGKTTRISYHKFPELPMVLVNLLKMGQTAEGVLIGSQSAESVFPALDIIRRAGPPEASRDVLYKLISWYLGSRIWHVREIAARTLCSFLLKSGWINDVQELFALSTSTNQLHGSFLTLKFLLDRLSEVMPEQISSQLLEILSRSLLEIAIGSENFKSCTEVQAAYIEVANLVKRLEQRAAIAEKTSAQIDVPQPVPGDWLSDRTSALLPIQIGVAQVQRTTRLAEAGVLDVTLQQALSEALSTDVNVSCEMLESLSILPDPLSGPTISMLIHVNTRACLESKALEPLSIALTNLSVLVDRVLHKATISNASVLDMLPKTEDLIQLWSKVTQSSITPSLSESAMSLGGSILAVAITRSEEQYQKDLPLWLRTWGAMMAIAGLAEQSFDARMAAAKAMGSLSLVIHSTRKISIDQAHLPWLVALYDSLNDDDDEVREVAAKAAGHLLGRSLAPIEAGAQLLAWLCVSFGQTDEFKARMASRLVGNEFGAGTGSSDAASTFSWSSAKDQLGVAMQFDDALFVVEEQNLYIDEVREAERWQAAFVTCFGSGLGDHTATSENQTKKIVESLSSWAASSMQTLSRITEQEGRDGPLGWTSKPAVFAICCRILVTSVSLVDAMVSKSQALEGSENSSKIKQELARFVELGKKNQVHGLLLGICQGIVDAQQQ